MKHVCCRIRRYATIPPVFQPHAEELSQLFSHGALQVDERNENENAIKERERKRGFHERLEWLEEEEDFRDTEKLIPLQSGWRFLRWKIY